MEEELVEVITFESKDDFMNKDFLDVLKMFAPGTSLRVALDDLLRAKMGALIIFDNGNISGMIEGGFKIDQKFSSQKLVELAKMDGAIVLSKEGKEILYANVLLTPDHTIFTRETGTRHKAAERSSKQSKTIVVAVSERKNKISVYYKEESYELESSSSILRKASETLQILEKQREIYDKLISDFTLLELTKSVTIRDLCLVLQKIEIIKKISLIVKRYLVELGNEGKVVGVRLRELLGDLGREEDFILKDYFRENSYKYLDVLEKMDFDVLLDYFNISKAFFDELHDNFIAPKGIRVLSKLNLSDRTNDLLIGNFEDFNEILNAKEKELLFALKDESLVSFFRMELYGLREKLGLFKTF